MANESKATKKTNGKKQPDAPPGPDQNLNRYEDIPHEIIPHDEKNGLTVIPTILTPEDQLKQEIQKFNLADSGIELLKQNYGSLKIAGADDKEGYKKVKAAWGEVRTKRTGLEKKGLELRQGYTIITKGISKEEDRLITLITPLENQLYKEWKDIDDAKELEKKRLDQEAENKLQARVTELLTNGMTMVDGFYQIGGTISMDVATLRGLPDAQYDKLLIAVQTKKAELDKIEKDRLELEQKQRQELLDQQEQLRQQQDQLKKQQEEFQQQQQKAKELQEQLDKERRDLRVGRLKEIGLVYRHDGNWVHDNGWNTPLLFNATNLMALEADPFTDAIANMKAQIDEQTADLAKHKLELEQEAKVLADKKTFIFGALDAIGLKYNPTGEVFTWSNPVHEISVGMNELIPLDGPAMVNKATEFGRRIQAAQDLQDKNDKEQKKKLEKERVASQSDAKNWAEYLFKIRETQVPTFKSAKYTKRATEFGDRFLNLIEEFSDDTETATPKK